MSAEPASSADPTLYFNRELSWLAFNERVLAEATDARHPLLERVKFLAIFFNNLDEFFMIRVSALQAQRSAGVAEVAADGLTPTQALASIGERVTSVVSEALACWRGLQLLLRQRRIEVCHYAELTTAEKDYLTQYFETEIFPILTPLAVDPGHPFPHISNLSLNLAVVIDSGAGEKFARLKVPPLPRLLPCGPESPTAPRTVVRRFVWLEEVIAHHIGALFPGYLPRAVYPFRVTRDADIEIQEDEAEDLLRAVEADIEKRHFSFVTRLEVTAAMPQSVRTLLIGGLEMDPRNIVVTGDPAGPGGAMGLAQLMELLRLDRPDLKYPPHVPRLPEALANGEEIFPVLSRQDVLLHHPYDSFAPVMSLIQAAARDPQVRAIKQTLYRVGSNSPLVQALIAARDADTQVAVLVELKARFDEENNIAWAKRLDDAGVHVVYGLIGLKTHCKVLLIVRREADGIRRYVHLGTGNYNATTARMYTDFAVMTTDPDLGADVTDLFNYLTGYSRQNSFRKILVAPINLRQRMAEMIQRETQHARDSRPARLIFQMNALVDPEMIELLYEASCEGVRVDLIVRGICCLVPGVAGVSENIRVISIVGRFLEHARIFYFENGGTPQLYMGSADLMPRNLDRRVEVVFPVESRELHQFVVGHVLHTQLADTVQARVLRSDGTWERVRPEGKKRGVDSQALFLRGARPKRTK
jgi:polyphosphate kinase